MMPLFITFCIPRNYLVVFLHAPWTGFMWVHVCVCHLQLFATPWTIACQAPLSMGFSRQEYWSGLPFSPPADLPDPGIKPPSLASQSLAGRFFTIEPPGDGGCMDSRDVISQFLRHLL